MLGKLVRRWLIGFAFIVIANYIIQYLINTIDITLKLWIFDFSAIVQAIFITILNLISFILLNIGLKGAKTQ